MKTIIKQGKARFITKELILAGFLALANLANAQWSTSGSSVYWTPGNVGVGLVPTGAGLIEVVNNNSGSAPFTAGYFESRNSNNGGSYTGITATSIKQGATNQTNVGVDATAISGGNTSIAYGVKGFADQANDNYGVYGTIGANPGANINAGIFGDDGGNGLGTYAAYFNGNVVVNGSGNVSGTWTTSDKRFKKNIIKLENVTEKILKVNGYSYNFRSDEFKEKRFDDRGHIGFIAQELKEVFPELVKEDAKGFYSVDYEGMVPVLLEALKVQQKKLDELNATFQNINKEGPATNINQNGSAISSFEVDQNVPNPFTHETLINYTLPEQTSDAFLAIYDLSGKQLSSFPLTQKGKSSITITSEKLAAGIYIYSVIADGKILDSKRMVIADK